MKMIEIVVWLNNQYTKHESIWVPEDFTREEITAEVNTKFDYWYSYDIHPL